MRGRVPWGSNSGSPGTESWVLSSHYIRRACQACRHSAEAETTGLEKQSRQREPKQGVEDPPDRRELDARAQGPDDPDTEVGRFNCVRGRESQTSL